MKKRNGFVSNSSSSSFIIVSDKEEIDTPLALNGTIKIPRNEMGEIDFSRIGGFYQDFDSKLNFIVLQALYSDIQEYMDAVLDVLKMKFGDEVKFEINLRREFYDFYEENADEKGLYYGSIDHDSIGGEFYNMLESAANGNTDDLYNFLFKSESYLMMGEDGFEESREELEKKGKVFSDFL
jgi:hypothetical protein